MIDLRFSSEEQPVCYDLQQSYTIEEVAETLAVDVRTVRDWITKGELRAVNVSRNPTSQKPRLRIMEDDVTSFLALRSVTTEKTSTKRRKIKPTQWV